MDMFSLGLVLLEAGSDVKLPGGGDAMYMPIRNNAIPAEFFQHISQELGDILRLMTQSDADKR